MARKLGYLTAVLILLAAGGIIYARAQGIAVPGMGVRPLAEMIEAPAASGDSITVAKFAKRRCGLLPDRLRQPCYDEILLALVERDQVRLAMDALSVLARIDPTTPAHGHDFAHVVGINAFTPGKNVGRVYESCTGLYQSGCYHGVVQAFLDANGTDSATVHALCNGMQATVTNMWLRFQCVHGIGHGLTNALSLNLPRALKGCDWLVDSWDAQSCYGGAFMEFIVAGRGQSHHPHGHKAAAAPVVATTAGDEHAGHDMANHEHADATGDHFAIRDKSDPLYPCSVLDTKYQASCYGMQAGIIIELTGPDYGKIAKACDEAPVAMQPSCYQGIGTYVSGVTVRNSQKSIDLCAKGDTRLQAWCYVGVVKNFIDVTAKADDGFDFCQRLTDRNYLVACYNAVGEEMAVLIRAPADREQQCGRAPKDYVEACRYGATLPAQRPKELQSFMPSS